MDLCSVAFIITFVRQFL